jgi:hypothetical protein
MATANCRRALLPAAVLLLVFMNYPVPAHTLISCYRSNLQDWIGAGRLYGLTEGALPFHVKDSQVIFYQLLHRAYAANLLAHCMFACGLTIWSSSVWRVRFPMSIPLAISSLLALSFISLYTQRLRRNRFDSCAVLGVLRRARTAELDRACDVHDLPAADAAKTLWSDAIDTLLGLLDDGIIVVETAGGPMFHLAPARSQCSSPLRSCYLSSCWRSICEALSRHRRTARGTMVFPFECDIR